MAKQYPAMKERSGKTCCMCPSQRGEKDAQRVWIRGRVWTSTEMWIKLGGAQDELRLYKPPLEKYQTGDETVCGERFKGDGHKFQ